MHVLIQIVTETFERSKRPKINVRTLIAAEQGRLHIATNIMRMAEGETGADEHPCRSALEAVPTEGVGLPNKHILRMATNIMRTAEGETPTSICSLVTEVPALRLPSWGARSM